MFIAGVDAAHYGGAQAGTVVSVVVEECLSGYFVLEVGSKVVEVAAEYLMHQAVIGRREYFASKIRAYDHSVITAFLIKHFRYGAEVVLSFFVNQTTGYAVEASFRSNYVMAVVKFFGMVDKRVVPYWHAFFILHAVPHYWLDAEYLGIGIVDSTLCGKPRNVGGKKLNV